MRQELVSSSMAAEGEFKFKRSAKTGLDCEDQRGFQRMPELEKKPRSRPSRPGPLRKNWQGRLVVAGRAESHPPSRRYWAGIALQNACLSAVSFWATPTSEAV